MVKERMREYWEDYRNKHKTAPRNTFTETVEKKLRGEKMQSILKGHWTKIQPEINLRYNLLFNRGEKNAYINISKYDQWPQLEICISRELTAKMKIK